MRKRKSLDRCRPNPLNAPSALDAISLIIGRRGGVGNFGKGISGRHSSSHELMLVLEAKINPESA